MGSDVIGITGITKIFFDRDKLEMNIISLEKVIRMVSISEICLWSLSPVGVN